MKSEIRFRHESLIGEGNFGNVWKSDDKQLNCYVAFKEATNEEFNLEKEIKIMKKLTEKRFTGTLLFIILGFPQLLFHNSKMTELAQEILGTTLKEEMNHRDFNLKEIGI